MTAQHIAQAQQRRLSRQEGGQVSLWFFVVALAVFTLLFTALGWMNWSYNAPVNETEAVDLYKAVKSGGLKIER